MSSGLTDLACFTSVNLAFFYIHTSFYFLFFQIKNTTCPRIAYASLGGSC